LLIRAASVDDAPAVAGLLGELGYPSEVDSVRARITRLLGAKSADPGDCVFVAADDDAGTILGTLALHRFLGLHDDAPVALITALVVGENARGLGVGKRLVDQAAETARQWGCTRLMVTTHVRRAGAHAFYERIGFELTGRRYVRTV
jgi:GNAT superfamily N-acetyltransferase